MTKIARFEVRSGAIPGAHYGIVEGQAVRLIEGDIFATWQPTRQSYALADLRLLAPVQPPNIYAIGLNYRLHAQESKMALPERPVIFIKATTAVINPEDNIVLPHVAPNEVDYECELAIIIGKRASKVSETDALNYVLGYTCGNDVSARDLQSRLDRQWARAKSCDTFAPLGPWIETDLDPDNAPIRTRLNGKVMQDSNTNDMIFSCPQLISHISQSMTLLPGTVIMTGTPSGVGFARNPPVFLRAGDVVEIEIDGIGTLRNKVTA